MEISSNTKINDFVTLTRSLSTIDKCLADITVCEHTRSTDIVPILTCERINARVKTNIIVI